MELTKKPFTFADMYTDNLVSAHHFLLRLNKLLNWQDLEILLKKAYSVGSSSNGRPAFGAVLLFKCLLLQYFYALSDEQLQEQIQDRLSFRKFLGLGLEDAVPDATRFCRFRKALTDADIWDMLLLQVNKQLQKHGVLVKTGVLVDASLTEASRQPKGKTVYNLEDKTDTAITPSEQTENTTDLGVELVKCTGTADVDARWMVKRGKFCYGYKQHVATNQDGLVLGVQTTPANKHDSPCFIPLLDSLEIEKDMLVMADKGYKSKKNDAYLKQKSYKNGILHKAGKGKPLTAEQIAFNKKISAVRFAIERTFGGIKAWFKGVRARYLGLAKMHAQHVLQAICYNLYRVPNLLPAIPKQTK